MKIKGIKISKRFDVEWNVILNGMEVMLRCNCFIMYVTQLWTAVGEYHCLSVTAVVLIGVFCLFGRAMQHVGS